MLQAAIRTGIWFRRRGCRCRAGRLHDGLHVPLRQHLGPGVLVRVRRPLPRPLPRDGLELDLDSFFTPFVTAAIGYRHGYVVFAACCLAMAATICFFLIELRNCTLGNLDNIACPDVGKRRTGLGWTFTPRWLGNQLENLFNEKDIQKAL